MTSSLGDLHCRLASREDSSGGSRPARRGSSIACAPSWWSSTPASRCFRRVRRLRPSASRDCSVQAEAAARPRLRTTPTRVSRRMAVSSDRRRPAFGRADKPSSELWTMVHRAELRLSRYSSHSRMGPIMDTQWTSDTAGAAHIWSLPHETDSTRHGRCRGNPPGADGERW